MPLFMRPAGASPLLLLLHIHDSPFVQRTKRGTSGSELREFDYKNQSLV